MAEAHAHGHAALKSCSVAQKCVSLLSGAAGQLPWPDMSIKKCGLALDIFCYYSYRQGWVAVMRLLINTQWQYKCTICIL